MKNRPLCKCGNLCKTNGVSKKDGRKLYNTYCRSCSAKRHGGRGGKKDKNRDLNLQYIKELCELCGFIPVHSCQLDVDHIDGNRDNYEPTNIQILCANCHRIKTYRNKDWEIKA